MNMGGNGDGRMYATMDATCLTLSWELLVMFADWFFRSIYRLGSSK
jgi:hypothetical protein